MSERRSASHTPSASSGGRTGDARRLLETLSGRSRPPAYAIAEIHLGLGEYDRAIDWLERASRGATRFLNWAAADPVFHEIRERPRFQRLLAGLGLPIQGSPRNMPSGRRKASAGP